ncbi:hypothetical protein BJX76DRAFT_357841 [Aspergillus varians]
MLEANCDLELHFGITNKIDKYGDRWLVIVLNPSTQRCNWYQSFPRKDGDTRSEITDVDFKITFEGTVPGPSQFFATRFIFACVKQNLIQNPVLTGLVSRAKYSTAELDHLGGSYFPVDEDFLYEASLAESI